jgi:hypothetical protein
LKPVFGDVWNETLFGPDYTDNLCSKLENSTQTAKYDAVLSVLEKGQWNAGSNSVVFWLTLIPKSLAGFNASSLGADFMYSSQSNGLQFPLFSVQSVNFHFNILHFKFSNLDTAQAQMDIGAPGMGKDPIFSTSQPARQNRELTTSVR